MKGKTSVIILFLFLSCLLLGTDAVPLWEFFENRDMDEISREEIQKGLYYTMETEDGRQILVTGRKIHVGDEYITGNNELYRVYKVEGYKARCRFVRRLGHSFAGDERGGILAAWGRYLFANKEEDNERSEPDPAPEGKPKGIIGVYHTHNAESYVPTDGTDSIEGKGGIHEVGDSFAAALRKKDITVLHAETLHLPHDRGAYRRSRATAQNLLSKGADAVFDVHRDAGPAGYYAVQIDGKWITQVQLVVGRQNPNMQTVRQYALDLKNTSDRLYPGLVKGIFLAHGNYNQDLAPTNLLLEVGTNMNSKDAAKDGAAMFADVVAYYFYGPNMQETQVPGQKTAAEESGKGKYGINLTAVRNAFWTMIATAAAGVVFFFINTPAGKAREKLLPYLEKTLPYTEKTDIFLDTVRGKIYDIARLAGEKTKHYLQQGDAALEKTVEFFRDKAAQLLDRSKTKV